MQCDQLHPYPTCIEIIRAIARALDVKNTCKTLDDKARDKNIDPRLINELIDQSIKEPIGKYISSEAAELITSMLNKVLSAYIYIVGNISADGVSRSQMMSILLHHFFNIHIAWLLTQVFNKTGGPNPLVLLEDNVQAVAITLDWIKENEAGWAVYIGDLDKDKRDVISAWHRGDNLPSCQYIQLLEGWFNDSCSTQVNWPRVRLLLFTARALEFIKKYTSKRAFVDAVKLALLNSDSKNSLEEIVHTSQRKYLDTIAEVIPSIVNIQHHLRSITVKTKEDKNNLINDIKRVRRHLIKKNQAQGIGYLMGWQEARWYTLSGELEKACELYQQAFNDSLYQSGENQKAIIEEALVIAASIKRPNKAFLKHLKWASTTFKYDLQSVSGTKASNKFSDSIEDWEVDLWKSHFNTIFPKNGFFPGDSVASKSERKGPLLISDDKPVKPDYRHPNRKIKIGGFWKKTMPQIVHFSQLEKVEVVKKLIDKGADINVFSDVGETPILFALEAMNVTEVPLQTLDDNLFKIISNLSHSSKIINKRTQKRRLLPIISAVQTGRPDIVKKTIELGADPNGRGLTDEQTPLNICLKYINRVKDPERAKKAQDSMPITPEVLDSHRRYMAGLSGFTLEQQLHSIAKFRHDKRYIKIKNQIESMMAERITKLMSLSNMRKIAKLLIEHGADTNAEHASPLKGYTSLMLAAEIDERELFEYMLVKGGNPAKHFTYHQTGKELNCWVIARYYESKGVQEVLNDIKHHFPFTKTAGYY